METVLNQEIATALIAHKDSIELLRTTLVKLSHAEKTRKQQYDNTWDKISHEKTEYQLSRYRANKSRSPNKIYLELIDNDSRYEIKYYVGKSTGILNKEQLNTLSIDFSTQKKPITLTKEMLKTQFAPKIKDILAITHERQHTRPQNPCFHELMTQLKRIKPDQTQAALLNEQFENQGYKIDVSPKNTELTKEKCPPNTLFLSLNQRKELEYRVLFHGEMVHGLLNREKLKKLNLRRLSAPLDTKETRAQLQKALPSILNITEKNKHTTQLMDDPERQHHFYKRLYQSHIIIPKIASQFRQKRINTLEIMSRIYDILNDIEQNVRQQIDPFKTKLPIILSLKNILDDHSNNKTPQERMDNFMKQIQNIDIINSLTTSSDSFIARCCKKIISYIRSQPPKEASFIHALNAELKKYDQTKAPDLTFSFFGKPPQWIASGLSLLINGPKPNS